MNVLEINGVKAVIAFDPDINMFRVSLLASMEEQIFMPQILKVFAGKVRLP